MLDHKAPGPGLTTSPWGFPPRRAAPQAPLARTHAGATLWAAELIARPKAGNPVHESKRLLSSLDSYLACQGPGLAVMPESCRRAGARTVDVVQ